MIDSDPNEDRENDEKDQIASPLMIIAENNELNMID